MSDKKETVSYKVREEIDSLVEKAKSTEAYNFIFTHTVFPVRKEDNRVYDTITKKFRRIELICHIDKFENGSVCVVHDTNQIIPLVSRETALQMGLTPVSLQEIQEYGKVVEVHICEGYDDNDEINRRIITGF